MSNLKKCPECGETFSGEEFCLIDGARLRRLNADPLQPEQAGPAMAGSAETAASRASGEARSWASRLSGLFGHDTARAAGSTARSDGPELPPELSGWAVSRPLREDRWADGSALHVVDGQGHKALYKRYTAGSLTSSENYAFLSKSGSGALAQLLAHGHFTGSDYELVAWDEKTVSFIEWMQSNSTEAAATWFLRQTLEILNALAPVHAAPLWIEPGSLAVRNGALLLTDFGKLMKAGAKSGEFLASLPAVRTEFAAAEILKSKSWVPNSPMYSAGVIAMQLASGHAPTHFAIERGDLDLRHVQDDWLRTALLGLLYPDHRRRWTLENLVKWSNGQVVGLPDWSRLHPGAAEDAFVLHGRGFFLPSDLAVPLLENLDAAAERLEDVLGWLGKNPVMKEIVTDILINQRAGKSADWLLLRLAHRLNPECPKIWRGISLGEEQVESNLVELGRRATAGDAQATELVERLRTADLRGVYPLDGRVSS